MCFKHILPRLRRNQPALLEITSKYTAYLSPMLPPGELFFKFALLNLATFGSSFFNVCLVGSARSLAPFFNAHKAPFIYFFRIFGYYLSSRDGGELFYFFNKLGFNEIRFNRLLQFLNLFFIGFQKITLETYLK